MQWYYAKGGNQVGPLEDHAFHELVRSGDIAADTPVWREGMPNWLPYGQVSGRAPAAPKQKLVLARDTGGGDAGAEAARTDSAGQALVSAARVTDADSAALLEPLYRSRKWMRLIGILAIIGGALQALTVVGLIVAWLPIWIGVLLTGAAKYLQLANETGDPIAAVSAMDKLRLYFKVLGVMAVIGLVLGLVGMVLAFMLPAVAFMRFRPLVH
jgi:hypothetical protein